MRRVVRRWRGVHTLRLGRRFGSFAVLRSLVFGRFVLGSFIFCSFVLSRLARSRVIRCGLVGVRLAFGGSVLGRFRLSCLVRFGLIRARFVLSRSILSSFVLGGLVFCGLRLVRPARRWSSVRCYHALAGKLARLGRCRNRRTPVIHRREHFMVPTGSALLS